MRVPALDRGQRPGLPGREKLLIGAFGALIAFGCFLRFWKFADDGLWYDELWTVAGASRPFLEMFREWSLGDPHPPGYFLFYFLWVRLFPADELWVRLPNAVGGTLTVLYLLFGARRVLSRDERIFAAALVSLSWLYLFYAVNVKQYSAVLLLATVATISYLEIARERRVERRTAVTLAATLVGLAYLNHFAFAYAWVLLALLAVTFRAEPTVLRPLRRIAVVLVVAYLPIVYSLYFPLLYSVNTEQSQLGTLLSDLLRGLFFDDAVFVTGFLVVLAAGLALPALSGRRMAAELRSSRNRHVLLVLATFASLLLALSLVQPIFVIRYFILLFPIASLAVAILIAAAFPIGRGWLAVLPLVFFARAAAANFRAIDGMQRQEWDASVDLVLASAEPGDAFYVLGSNPNRPIRDYLAAGDIDGAVYSKNLAFYEWYFRRRGGEEIAGSLNVLEPTAESVADLVRAHERSGRTVYILAGHHIQLDADMLCTLEQASSSFEPTWLYSTVVYEVAFPATADAPPAGPAIYCWQPEATNPTAAPKP